MNSIAASAYREFVFGGHLLALGTASIAASAAAILGTTPTFDLLVMAYLFSHGAYTLNRLNEMDQDNISNPERTAHLGRRRRFLPYLAGVYFVVGYAMAFSRSLVFFASLLLPLLLALAYSVGSKKLVGFAGVTRLKDKLLVKNLVISFGWSLIPVIVGAYYMKETGSLLAFAPFVFLRLMVNTIFFDIRDVRADSAFGTRTLPSVYGLPTARTLMSLIDLASFVYILAILLEKVLPVYFVPLALMPLYSAAYTRLSSSGRMDQNRLRDLVADGEYLLWGPLVFLGRI